MTTPAAATILTAPSKPRRVSCICSSDECKQLTICFQSVDNDIRGLFMQLPSITGKVLAGLKEHRVKRTLIHLNQYSPDKDTWQCTIDRRKSSPKQMKLRSEEPEVVQSKKYIANHHFHPEILQLMVNQGMTNIDCTTEELIREWGLIGNGYTSADLYSGKVAEKTKSILSLPGGSTNGPYYVPVPSYKGAKDDYQQVSMRWRLNKLVKDCQEKCRWNSALAPRGEDNDVLQPVEKRARRIGELPALESNNITELQRAVCMLAEERDRKQAELKRLKDEIRRRETNSLAGEL